MGTCVCARATYGSGGGGVGVVVGESVVDNVDNVDNVDQVDMGPMADC